MTAAASIQSLKARWSLRLRRQALDLGLYGRSDYQPFLVLGRSRVGSNLLRGLLNAHSQIAAFGEIFREPGALDWDHTGYFQRESARALLARDPVRFLDGQVFGRYPGRIRAVGFKLFYYHAQEGSAAAVWRYLRDRTDLKVIHLKRRNVLQTHLSRRRAALTDRWVDTSGQPDAADAIRLEYEDCLRDFVQTRSWEEQADREFAGHPTLEVEYERLAADYRAEAASIQRFLGVRPEEVAPSTFRQARQPLSALIANYDELKARFRGTAWQEFFVD